MPPSRHRSARHPHVSHLVTEDIWRLGLIVVFVVALFPSNLALIDYGSELAVESYELVKAGMPFIPLGALLVLVWRRSEIQLVVMALYLIMLPALWVLPEWGWAETHNLLFAWPGLAFGMALGTTTQRAFSPPVKVGYRSAARP